VDSTVLSKVISKTVSKVVTKGVAVVDSDVVNSKQGGGGVIVVGSGKGPVPAKG
jgi:hypothetical protein